MGEQTNVIMESVETSQEQPMNYIIEEAAPRIFSPDMLDPCQAHLGVDNFNVDRYDIDIDKPIDMPYVETIPIWIEQQEPVPITPIAPFLEPPPILELKPLPDAPIDIPSVILNQEAQLSGVLKTYKAVIGWDISDMRDLDLNDFIFDFSIFGTTFEERLQNLSEILKQCMETGLMLIWIKCHREGARTKYITSKKGNRVDQAINEEIPKLPSPILDQQNQSLPRCHKILKSGSSMPIQCTLLIRVNHRKILYERFSAMMTRPPDWPYPFGTLRDIPTLDITATPS